MTPEELKKTMTFNENDAPVVPLEVFEVNGSFIVGVYQGSFSKFDILIKYRQKKLDGTWSRIRTPKHIHWAVDILIKFHEDKKKTQEFLDFLIGVWQSIEPIKDKKAQQDRLNLEDLLQDSKEKITEYDSLGTKGEYSVKFLILLAKLLMIQEKTNLETAYMFKSLLEALCRGDDIFSIVSIASHTGRK